MWSFIYVAMWDEIWMKQRKCKNLNDFESKISYRKLFGWEVTKQLIFWITLKITRKNM